MNWTDYISWRFPLRLSSALSKHRWDVRLCALRSSLIFSLRKLKLFPLRSSSLSLLTPCRTCVRWGTEAAYPSQHDLFHFDLRQNKCAFCLQRSLLPKFLIRGHLDATNCVISQPLTGEVVVENSDVPIKSIELQLVRVETCGEFTLSEDVLLL